MADFLASARTARLRLWGLNRRLVQPKLARLASDPLIRQARQLQRAYAGPNGPNVLIIGDSVMMWTTPFDDDKRTLADMIQDIVGPSMTFLSISGKGYNPRLIMSLLTALDGAPAQPDVVIVPASVNTSNEALLTNHRTSFAHEAASLRSVIARRSWSTRRLAAMPDEEIDRYDRRPAPSWFGANRTYGELDLIMHAKSRHRWQSTVRMQSVMDFNTAERLREDAAGPSLIREMSADLKARGIRTIAYVGPMNFGLLESMGGEHVREHLQHNATVVESAFTSEAGPESTILNFAVQFDETEFGDHLHIKDHARGVVAHQIAAAIRGVDV